MNAPLLCDLELDHITEMQIPEPEVLVLVQSLDLFLQDWQPEGHEVKIFEAHPFSFFCSKVEFFHGYLCLPLTHGHFMQNLEIEQDRLRPV